MDVWQALYERRSVRDFDQTKKIPQDVMDKIMKSAWHALPAPDGQFPWRFIVVRDDAEVKEQLALSAKEVAKSAFGSSFEIFGPGHLWYMPMDVQLRTAEYTTTGDLWLYPRTADAVFVTAVNNGCWTDTLGSHSYDFELMVQYIGFAVQNMWLTAHKYGLGCGYNGMPMLDNRRRELNCELLAMPRSWESAGAFCIGYGKAPRYFGPTRPGLEGMVFSEYWGNTYCRMALEEEKYEAMELPQMEIEDAIANLNYVQSFEEGTIPRWQIEKILDVGMWGPMPEMVKNWRAIVIRDKETKDFLQRLLTEKKSAPWSFCWPEMLHSRTTGTEEERLTKMEEMLTSGYGNWLSEADTLILMTATFMSWFDNPDEGIAAGVTPVFGVSTACCLQNMKIAATALGLGLNYEARVTGDAKTKELLMDFLGIPTTWVPVGILALGRPGVSAEIRRPPLEQLFHGEYWGNPCIARIK